MHPRREGCPLNGEATGVLPSRTMRRVALAVLALTLAPGTAAADWPEARASAPRDVLAGFRWGELPAWIAPSPVRPLAALEAMDAAEPGAAPRWAERAVLLRLVSRVEASSAALARARAERGDGALDDPDALLTEAWIEARRSQFERAVSLAVQALPRMPRSPWTASLTLTVARWSLARGPEGLASARALLDALRVVGPLAPRAAALLALVYARGGDEAGARAIVREMGLSVSASLAEPLGADRQDPAFAEQINAAGVALVLAGRGAEAAPLLSRAEALTPPGWRDFQRRMSLRAGP